MFLVLSLAAFLPGSARADEDSKSLASKAMGILEKHCSRCHGVAKESGDLDVRDRKSLLGKTDDGTAYILPKEPGKSYILERIKKGEMPPSGAKVSAEDAKTLEEWVKEGAPESSDKEKPRAYISFEETLSAIRDHMRAADEEDQPYLRYFLLTSAHNDPRVKDSDLRMYRAALSKAINSLTWKRNIVLPKAVDDAGTIFAIDLRDLDWDRKRDGNGKT